MTQPLVLFLDPFSPEVRAAIEAEAPASLTVRLATSSDPAEIAPFLGEAEFFVGGIAPISAALLAAAPKLRLIHKWGIGVDKIDLAAARARGIPVTITAGANAVAVAELTLLLILAVLRRLPHRQAQLRAGEWARARAEARVQAFQLRRKVVALVGLGAIGREVAKRLRAFDAEVRYHDVRRIPADEEQRLGVTYAELDSLLAAADVVSLHVPLLPSTQGLLSRQRIARLKRGAIVVNTARGELVDEVALAEALESGHLAGAGFDVFSPEPPPADHPLMQSSAPGLVLAPHIAGSVFDNVPDVARHVFGNIRRVLAGEPIPERDLVR
ncbi:MAG: dehydrogenase [Chloroflexi bacterium]|nr:dehydrogenase [Chloroflexota bacterium]